MSVGFVLALSGTTIALLIVLGLMLGIVLWMRSRSSSGSKSAAAPVDLASLSIRDARRGDMVTVRAAAPDFDDLTFEVEQIHRYESGSEKWYELQGRSPHGLVCLEWYEDDGLEISLVLGKSNHRIEALGLTEDDLVRMDDEQSSSNSVEHEGTKFHYEASGEIGFFEDGRGEGEGFYCWEFSSPDGKRGLCIEKWEGEAFEALFSTSIAPSDVTLYRS